MSMSKERAKDMLHLQIMHLRENEGLSMRQVAEHLGLRRNQVIGLVHRINRAADAEPCACHLKRNKDGGMKPLWWAV